MSIEVWTKTNCPRCRSTARVLDDRDVTITYRSFDDEPGLVHEAKALGFSEAPVVITPDDAWTGYRPDKLIGLPK